MSKQLYEEALADVKKLKEVAEDNAKRALLEAVTPRIKDLIENQLLGEAEKDEDGELLLDDEPEGLPMTPVAGIGDSELSAAAISMPDAEGKVTLDLDALQPEAPLDDFDVSPLRVSGQDEVYELSAESAKTLGLLVNESGFDKKIKSVGIKLRSMSTASRIIRESSGFNDLISSLFGEVEDMYAHVQENMRLSSKKSSYESILESYYSTLKQLTEQEMKRKINVLSEADLTLKLTGLPEDVDLESVGVDLVAEEPEEEEGLEGEEEETGDEEEGGEDLDLDLGDEEEDEEKEEGQKMESRSLSDNLVVEIDEGMLRREISRMKAIREAKEDVQSWGHGAGHVSSSEDFEDDDLGDPFVDVDLRETQEEETKDESKAAAKHDEEEVVEVVSDEEDVKGKGMDEYSGMEEAEEMEEMELDELEQAEDTEAHGGPKADAQSQKQKRSPATESILKRLDHEAKIQLEAKHKAQKAKQAGKKAQTEQQQAKKKGQQKTAADKGKQAKKMKEAYVHYAKQFNESVLRTQKLKGMLNEASHKGNALNGAPVRSAAETNVLRDKLAETNLFNTKLLFANKVLQNESFTRTQKAGIIERLDEARSEREVKLVYESLVKTLDNTTRRQVNESRERAVLGSSSRPTRPASTLNEGFETDRWARLAGIVK